MDTDPLMLRCGNGLEIWEMGNNSGYNCKFP
jgi:hypothetical protein